MLEDIVRHELKARFEIRWQCFLARLESFGVVLNDEFEIRRNFRNGLTDMTTSTSNLETDAVSASDGCQQLTSISETYVHEGCVPKTWSIKSPHKKRAIKWPTRPTQRAHCESKSLTSLKLSFKGKTNACLSRLSSIIRIRFEPINVS